MLQDGDGIRIATILYNNHVPFYGATKPELVREYEEKTGLYLKQQFDAEIPVSEAHKQLAVAYELKLSRVKTEVNREEFPSELRQSTNVNFLKGYISNLEKRMKQADWYYSYSDDRSVWQKGVQETDGIIKDIQALSRLPGGVTKANELWDKYVPEYSIHKPDFLNANAFNQAEKTTKNEITEPSVVKRAHFLKQKTSLHTQKRRPRHKN